MHIIWTNKSLSLSRCALEHTHTMKSVRNYTYWSAPLASWTRRRQWLSTATRRRPLPSTGEVIGDWRHHEPLLVDADHPRWPPAVCACAFVHGMVTTNSSTDDNDAVIIHFWLNDLLATKGQGPLIHHIIITEAHIAIGEETVSEEKYKYGDIH